MKKIMIFLSFANFIIPISGYSQWEAGAGLGLSIPITSYGEVVKTGWLINLDGKCRLTNQKFSIGAKLQFARLQNDKDPDDEFMDTRMTLTPLIFTAEYGVAKGSVQPYVTGGLGITFFNIHYEVSSTAGTSENNVSFTMMALAGLRFAASETLLPFIETGLVFIADGPPVGFPESDHVTGYNGITAGITYRFNR